MISTRGRLSSLPIIYNNYMKEAVAISLLKERIVLFPDGSVFRTFRGKNNKFINSSE